MAVAFYAPLKSPDHPVPSGDREMARALFSLLEQLGRAPFLASRLRSFDRSGDAARQARMEAIAEREAARIGRRIARELLPRPTAWFTYHGYHKAPDHLGPALSRKLGVPYVLAEPSLAGKQAAGPWKLGHATTVRALAAADLVLALTRRDQAGLFPALRPGTPAELLRPFIDTGLFHPGDRLAARAALGVGPADATPLLLTVAMMRADVKQLSYTLLRQTLSLGLDHPWRLLIVGDGPARAVIEADFATLGHDRVRFMGAVPRDALAQLYRAADLFVWPALQEAYGLVLLEAQACGLPVLACAEGGVPEIVVDGTTGRLVQAPDAALLAGTLAELLAQPRQLEAMAVAAATHVQRRHSRAAAAATLGGALVRLSGGSRTPAAVPP